MKNYIKDKIRVISSHVKSKALAASTSTTSCTSSLLLKSTAKGISSWTAASAHEASEASSIIHATHLLSHEHLEDIVRVNTSHSSHASSRTTTSHIECEPAGHAAHTTAWESSHAIRHVVSAESHVVLLSLLWVG